MKIAFFEIKKWEEDFVRAHLHGHDLVFSDKELNKNTLPEQSDFDIISVFVDSQINQQVINHFPNLKMITTRTTGTDHIDEGFAQSKSILVKNVPNYGESTVAEYTFALLLALARKIPQAVARVKQEDNFNSEGLTGFDLVGKALGVIGTGNIGQHVIHIAKGFGMKVIAFDVKQQNELAQRLDFSYVNLEELLESADVVTLHIPYLPATHHLINKDNIFRFKKGAVLINTSRGAIIETAALINALREKLLAGAALDVLEEETLLDKTAAANIEDQVNSEEKGLIEQNKELVAMENVLVTPHNAFNSHEARVRILEKTIENIVE